MVLPNIACTRLAALAGDASVIAMTGRPDSRGRSAAFLAALLHVRCIQYLCVR